MTDKEPARTGATIDFAGHEAPLGHIPERFSRDFEPGSLAARAVETKAAAEEIVRSYHNLNRIAVEAKAQGKDPAPLLPDVPVQLAMYKTDMEKAAKLAADVKLAEVEHMREGEIMSPYDYSRDGTVDFLKSQELRATFARMTPEQRTAALLRPNYRKAVLQTEAEASGITPSDRTFIRDETLRILQPGLLERREVERLALDAMKQSLSTAQQALAATATRLGANLKPAPKPTPVGEWRR